MEIQVSEKIIDTICNSLRASKYNLKTQLSCTTKENKKEILESQLTDIEEALCIFEQVE